MCSTSVTLKPGERRRTPFPITRRTLCYWDEPMSRWTTLKGKADVYVGSSAADMEHAGIITVK
ncbi:fibronectin type III-like domain-contianing protein [Streptomyces mirabilis]|uniref:fibronectin type III-like domain-contianing protein n=1 Tax=Streptomyces mirabilis TaxID=68239 RepID=UPI0033D56311